MPRHSLEVIVALDGSGAADSAVFQTLPLLRSDRVRVTLLTVIDPMPLRRTLKPLRGARDELLTAAGVDRARDHLQAVARSLGASGVAVAERVVTVGEPVEVIVRLASERAPALVLMRTHGRRGLARLTHGSVTSELLRRCPAPLLLLRGEQQLFGLEKILVPLDGSDCAANILEPVEHLAGAFGSEVALLTVGASDDQPDALRRLEDALSLTAERLIARGLRVRILARQGDPAEWILRVREAQGFGLIAMTTHGVSGLRRLALGSVAHDVLRQSPVPVLALPVRHDAARAHGDRPLEDAGAAGP